MISNLVTSQIWKKTLDHVTLGGSIKPLEGKHSKYVIDNKQYGSCIHNSKSS
jgi:hypothetical protein